jgi:hypothetical protein
MMKQDGLHENLYREDEIVGPSNRKFGITFAVVFALLATLKLYHWSPWFYAWAALCVMMLALSFLWPEGLAPLNRAWLKLGLLLHRLVNPVVMMLLFYGTILPIGLLMRLSGKDLLRLKRDPHAKSYWIQRTDDRPWAESMRQQF